MKYYCSCRQVWIRCGYVSDLRVNWMQKYLQKQLLHYNCLLCNVVEQFTEMGVFRVIDVFGVTLPRKQPLCVVFDMKNMKSVYDDVKRFDSK